MEQRELRCPTTLASPNGFFWAREGRTVRFIKLPFAPAKPQDLVTLPFPVQAERTA